MNCKKITTFILAISIIISVPILYKNKFFVDSSPFIKFSQKNSKINVEEMETIKSKINKEIKLIKKGTKKEYSKEVVLQLPLGTEDSDFGIEELEVEGSYIAPGSIAIGKNGKIYIDDPVNKAINQYSSKGKLMKKFIINDYPRELDTDFDGNLYVLGIGNKSVYMKKADKDEFNSIIENLNEPHKIKVTPNGKIMVLDYTGLPNDNLRIQKFESSGKKLNGKEQHNHSLSLYEYEDLNSEVVKIKKLGGGISGVQYYLNKANDELVYRPDLPKGYIYNLLDVIGLDNKGRMYYLRIIKPDNPELSLKETSEKMETWVDIIDFKNNSIDSIQLENDNVLFGPTRSEHRYDIDSKGNIYQLIETTSQLKVIKYSY